MIRFLIAGLILSGMMLPTAEAGTASPKSQCKNQCGSMYRFCKIKATTKQAKAFCKADRRSCKRTCR